MREKSEKESDSQDPFPARKPAQHRIPRRSFLYDRVIPALILTMGLLMVILILVAAGVLLGIVPFQ